MAAAPKKKTAKKKAAAKTAVKASSPKKAAAPLQEPNLNKDTLVIVRMMPSQLEAIDGIVRAEKSKWGRPISRSEILRQLIVTGARAMGYEIPSHVGE